jgi:hypothetical protein
MADEEPEQIPEESEQIPTGGDLGGVVPTPLPGEEQIRDVIAGAGERAADANWWEWPLMFTPQSPLLQPVRDRIGLKKWAGLALDAVLPPPQRPIHEGPDPAFHPTEVEEAGIVADQADDPTVLKALYFDAMSEEAQFNKIVNYLSSNGIITISPGVGGLGEALVNTLDGIEGAAIYDLASEEGKGFVRSYLLDNWQQIPDLVEQVASNLSAGYRKYRTAWEAGGRVPFGYRAVEETVDPNTIVSLLQEFGDLNFGADIPTLREVGEVYGSGPTDQIPIADIAHGALETAVDEFMERVIGPNQSLFVGPDGPPSEEGLKQVGFITSFDGTPFGEVNSFNDLFSGGQIGPMHMVKQLKRADSETIEKFQREFVALGLMRAPEAWGYLQEDATGTDPTIHAAVKWQVGITQAALDMVDSGGELDIDGTPYIRAVEDRYIANRMAGESTRATQRRELMDRTISEASLRVQRYLSNTGRYLPEGAQLQLQNGLQEILNNMSSSALEQQYGQGGSSWERSLAENVLRKFYGVDDWGRALTFGATNRDQDYFNYAARVGAVSNRERELLRYGAINRQRYRGHWKGREDELVEAEKDVAVAALLKFISEDMEGDLVDATAADVTRGLNTYMYTIGARQKNQNGFTQNDLAEFAESALSSARSSVDPLVEDLAEQGAQQFGSGVGGYRFKNLVNTLNRVSSSVQGLRSPNV